MAGRIHVTTPRRSRTGSPGIRLHRVRRLHPDDVTSLRGHTGHHSGAHSRRLDRRAGNTWPRSDPARGGLPAPARPSAIDAAMARAHGRRRLARLDAALEIHRPATVVRSELEHRFLELCRRAQVPAPETNVTLRAGRELVRGRLPLAGAAGGGGARRCGGTRHLTGVREGSGARRRSGSCRLSLLALHLAPAHPPSGGRH